MKHKDSVDQIKFWLGTGSINIFGRPFAGKDTHGLELAKMLGGSFVGSGDVLRSSNHKHINEHVNRGNLAPTDAFLELIVPYLSQDKFAGKPLILSSVGRWHGEEPSIEEATEQSGHPIKAVLYLKVPKEEAEKRWHLAERGREDDAAYHILLNRFNEFETKTLPVIAYYRKKGLLIEVNAIPPKEEVTEEILSKLVKYTKK